MSYSATGTIVYGFEVASYDDGTPWEDLPDQYDEWLELHNADAFGVGIETEGHYDYPRYYLCAAGVLGSPDKIDYTKEAEYQEQLQAFCKNAGIRFQKSFWRVLGRYW